MELPKCGNANRKCDLEAAGECDVNVMQLPLDVWEHLFGYISDNDVITLSSVSKRIQWIVQTIKNDFNLTCDNDLNLNCLLNYTLSASCTSINIDYCYWLEPREILNIISRTKLEHLHVIECNVDEDCMKSIINLDLKSLSMTYSKCWRSYFQDHFQECQIFLHRLNTLEISYSQSLCSSLNLKSRTNLFDIYLNVLRHCKQLQHLKVFDYSDERCSDDEKSQSKHLTSDFILESSPLPKLKSLEINIQFEDCTNDVTRFLEIILQDKVIPLDLVDVGQFTTALLEYGVLRHPLILREKHTFLLSQMNKTGRRSSFVEQESALLKSTTLKKICLHNFDINKFQLIVDQIISSSGNSLQEIHIENCRIYETALEGIESFSINCPQITVLDLTVLNWHENISADVYARNLVFCGYERVAKNKALLDALTNFKNLKELMITPSMLLCDYYKSDILTVSNHLEIMPFWKVTKSCQKLRKLHIKNVDPIYCIVHMDSVYDIAFCNNLRVLHLIDFKIRGEADFLLPKITKGCAQLEELRMQEMAVIPLRHFKHKTCRFIVDDGLSFTKNLQKLRFDVMNNSSLNKTFVDSLCLLENLEKIDIMLYNWKDDVVEYLADSLPKVKNLFLVLIQFDQNTTFDERLNSVFQKIKEKKTSILRLCKSGSYISTITFLRRCFLLL